MCRAFSLLTVWRGRLAPAVAVVVDIEATEAPLLSDVMYMEGLDSVGVVWITDEQDVKGVVVELNNWTAK